MKGSVKLVLSGDGVSLGGLGGKNPQSAASSPLPLGPPLRCDCAVTSEVRGGVLDQSGIPTGLKTQHLDQTRLS
jgi:hypothetical protein